MVDFNRILLEELKDRVLYWYDSLIQVTEDEHLDILEMQIKERMSLW